MSVKVIAHRIEDVPEPTVPSIQMCCIKCNKPAWVDDIIWNENNDVLVICSICIIDHYEEMGVSKRFAKAIYNLTPKGARRIDYAG